MNTDEKTTNVYFEKSPTFVGYLVNLVCLVFLIAEEFREELDYYFYLFAGNSIVEKLVNEIAREISISHEKTGAKKSSKRRNGGGRGL